MRAGKASGGRDPAGRGEAGRRGGKKLMWGCGGNPGQNEARMDKQMYSSEQRGLAVEAFARFDRSYGDTIAGSATRTRHPARQAEGATALM